MPRISILNLSISSALVLFMAQDAMARPSFPDRIPNGSVNSCGTCHVNPAGGGPRNSFGQAFGAAGLQWTMALAEDDSDADGQTNGEELGDPCFDWMVGATPPRLTDISEPGNAASMSNDPNSPSCGTPDAGVTPVDAGFAPDQGVTVPDAGVDPVDTGVTNPAPAPTAPPEEEDDGGCSATGRRGDVDTWGLMMVLFTAAWLRRRWRARR